jgi:hypothetical protein
MLIPRIPSLFPSPGTNRKIKIEELNKRRYLEQTGKY